MSFRKRHEKATAESFQLTKMPVIQLSELSGENEALCLKSPEKPQYSDKDHIPADYRSATPFQEHEIDFHERLYIIRKTLRLLIKTV